MGNPVVLYESGQQSYAFEQMTDSGDNTVFAASFAPISEASGYEAVVAPYGLSTGGAITVDTGTNDSVAVASLTAVMPGATGADANGVVTVSGANVSISRGVTTDTHRITSITVNSSGALAAVAGVDNTAFSATRGAAGGPPYIPVGSIEIGQVRTTSVTAAEVLSTEIFVVVGLHRERSDYPTYQIDNATGKVTFNSTVDPIHTGDVPKQVWIKGATPIFAKAGYTSDWTAAKASYSVSSVDTYDGPVGSSSSSLGQASFTAQLTDGISDDLAKQAGKTLWFEYRPDRDKLLPKQLTQGILGISVTNPVSGKRPASVTITASQETVDVTQ